MRWNESNKNMPDENTDASIQRWLAFLEAEWSKPEGFLGRAREGLFDSQRGDEFVEKLQRIRLQDGDRIDRRLVSLLWYIPTFLRWQKERISESGGDTIAFERLSNRVQTVVEGILGVP
jgi:hypothetical protein